MDKTLNLFLHSVEKDIVYLESLNTSTSILNKLRGLLDNVRSQWAYIYSNDKKGYGNRVGAYFTLNLDVNKVYDEVLNERADYLLEHIDEPTGPIDEFLIKEFFLSYTIFLDAYSELGFYYALCLNFPFRNSVYYATQKMARQMDRRLDNKD